MILSEIRLYSVKMYKIIEESNSRDAVQNQLDEGGIVLLFILKKVLFEKRNPTCFDPGKGLHQGSWL